MTLSNFNRRLNSEITKSLHYTLTKYPNLPIYGAILFIFTRAMDYNLTIFLIGLYPNIFSESNPIANAFGFNIPIVFNLIYIGIIFVIALKVQRHPTGKYAHFFLLLILTSAAMSCVPVVNNLILLTRL